MNNEELKHHGIKGQKWGRRRYQNKDGTLTAEGKKRYGNISPEEFDEKRAKERASDVQQMKNARSAADSGKGTATAVGQYADKMHSKRQSAVDREVEDAIRKRVYKMSDEELKAAVNRINMEERYTQVMQQRERIDVGRSKTEKFLSVASNALALSGTALTVAIMIRELQK